MINENWSFTLDDLIYYDSYFYILFEEKKSIKDVVNYFFDFLKEKKYTPIICENNIYQVSSFSDKYNDYNLTIEPLAFLKDSSYNIFKIEDRNYQSKELKTIYNLIKDSFDCI